MAVEYRVREIKRYIVTRFDGGGDDVPAQSSATQCAGRNISNPESQSEASTSSTLAYLMAFQYPQTNIFMGAGYPASTTGREATRLHSRLRTIAAAPRVVFPLHTTASSEQDRNNPR